MSAAHDRAARRIVSAALLLTGACFDASAPATAPSATSLSVVSRIECVASTLARTVACARDAAPAVLREDAQSGARLGAPKALRDIIVGNQGGYVKLTSSNINVAGGVFSFDVTLQNKIAQAIGTTDGFSPAPSGSRVFFLADPQRTTGTGTIDFVNPGGGFFYDGRTMFTSSNQAYFQYDGVLQQGDVSAAKTWRLRFDPGVLTFTFSVYVSAPVKFPDGYVDGNPNVLTLNPAEQSPSLGGTVYSAVGNVMGGAIGYVSSAPGVASVDAAGVVTAGASNAITSITLSSGAIPNARTTAINVCASTPTLVSGVPVMGTIDATDCYSSFAGNNDRPDPSFQSDLYRVALTAGQQIGITMTSDGTFAPCLFLADPSGVRVGLACTSGSTETIPLGAPMPVTGVYTIEAGQTDPFAGTPGNYTIGVTITP